MGILEMFEQNYILFLIYVFCISACIGSFLNVVIYRLPIILSREWQKEAFEVLNEYQKELFQKNNLQLPNFEKISLAYPRSKCTNCQNQIKWYQNIPIISYLFLKGRCSNCKSPISMSYPIIELFTAFLITFVTYKFGISLKTFFLSIFIFSMITLFMIDMNEMLLPDIIVIPTLWIGIIASIFKIWVDLESSVLGAIFGYLFFWIITKLFSIIFNKDGMGAGDFKLLACIGAWGGWQIILIVVISTSIIASIFGIIQLTLQKKDIEKTPLPFGNYLATAGVLILIFYDYFNKFNNF